MSQPDDDTLRRALRKLAQHVADTDPHPQYATDADLAALVTGATGPQGAAGQDGQDGEPGVMGPPGQAGAPGAAGSPGPQGAPGVAGQDGQDGVDGSPGPAGPAGAAGAPGSTGPAGPQGPQGPPGQDGQDGQDGAQGPAGPTGGSVTPSGTGLPHVVAGVQNATASLVFDEDVDAAAKIQLSKLELPLAPSLLVGSGTGSAWQPIELGTGLSMAGTVLNAASGGSSGPSVGVALAGQEQVAEDSLGAALGRDSNLQRAQLGPDAKGWVFLGSATGATVTVGPVVWTGQYRQIQVWYVITGYSGGTPVGRLLVGAASISTTALTNGSRLSENVTAPTSAPSIPGMPLAVTLSNIARRGVVTIDGASGSLKLLDCVGQNGNPAVATPPTLFRAAGVFSDLGTNLLLQRAQLTSYDTLTATAASANTFTTGTYLAVWGRNTD